MNAVFLLDGQPSTMVRLSEPLRPLAWQMFLQAVIDRPYFGYGWDQTGQAHLAMSLASPSLGVHFGQAHNIILDFFIWSGVPLGLFICGVLIFTIYRTFRGLNVGSDLFVFACLLIVGVHGMLELPLHYTYFLVPSGFFWGVLLGKSTFPSIGSVPRYVVVISLMTVTVLSALVIRDYFEVEVRFRDMLHEKARIGTNHPGLLPEVVVLNQLRESIALARYDPEENAAPDDLVWAERVAKESPSMGNIYKLALLLAKNGKRADATAWLQRACAVMSKTECVTLSKVWQQQVEKDQRLTNVFPSEVLK